MLAGMRSPAGILSGAGGILLYADTYSAGDTAPTPATASFQVAATGIATGADSGARLTYNTGAAGAGYEIRATLTSGTFTGGTAATWLALSSSRTWTATRAAVGTKTVTATFEIRNASTLTVLATASITLTATLT